MSDVSRDEFNELARRVTALERSLAAVAELIAAQIVPHLDAIDEKIDRLGAKVDGYAEQVNQAMGAFDAQAARHERFTTAIAAHFGIDLGD